MQYFNSGISWQLSIVCTDTSIVYVVLLYFTVERVQKVLQFWEYRYCNWRYTYCTLL